MSYEIAPMILFSQDRTRMLNFLSDVFEFEVDSDEFLVFHRDLRFRLLSGDTKLINPNSSIVFNFKVNEEFEIEEILNKYNFFQYRRGQSDLLESADIIDTEEFKILKITDIDHRPWCFEFRKAH